MAWPRPSTLNGMNPVTMSFLLWDCYTSPLMVKIGQEFTKRCAIGSPECQTCSSLLPCVIFWCQNGDSSFSPMVPGVKEHKEVGLAVIACSSLRVLLCSLIKLCCLWRPIPPTLQNWETIFHGSLVFLLILHADTNSFCSELFFQGCLYRNNLIR